MSQTFFNHSLGVGGTIGCGRSFLDDAAASLAMHRAINGATLLVRNRDGLGLPWFGTDLTCFLHTDCPAFTTVAKKKKKAPKPPEIDLPPLVPETLADLDRAVMLLGILAKGQPMKKSRQDEIKTLLGAVPQPEVAAAWKSELKRCRDEYV